MRYKELKDIKDKEERAYSYFIEKGLSPIQASALVGNFIVESGLNTTIEGDKNLDTPSVGIAQWRESRLDNLRNRYEDPYDFDNQLDFVWWELNNSHKKAFDELKQAQTPEDAAIVVRKRYEVAWGGHDDRRIKQSLNIYNKFAPQQEPVVAQQQQPQIKETTTQAIDNTYYYQPRAPKKHNYTLPKIENEEEKVVEQVKEEVKQQQNEQDFLKEIMRLSQVQYVDPEAN